MTFRISNTNPEHNSIGTDIKNSLFHLDLLLRIEVGGLNPLLGIGPFILKAAVYLV